MTEVSEISNEHWDAWRSVFAMRRQLDLVLERRLQQMADISQSEFEVLLAIFQEPGGQLRGRQLGERLGWERSRVSHLITRMERRGLVARNECTVDLRGTWIVLTSDGKRAVLGSMRDHAATIRRYFFDVLSDDELAVLATASNRILDAIGAAPCDDAPPCDETPAGDTEDAETVPTSAQTLP
jgi:DNA-binding MarR family transcriptional regulator